MKTLFKFGILGFFVVIGLPLLVLADFVFSVAGPSWDLKAIALTLIVLSSVPFYVVVGRRIDKSGPSELQLMIFSVCWGAFFFLLMTFAQDLRQSQGISSYWNRLGNCGTLFSPISGSDFGKSWMDARRPTFHYAFAVAEDFCRLNRLYQDFSSSDPTVCASMGVIDRTKCFRRAFEEIMVKEPLTLPGVNLALLEGLALSLKQDPVGTDRVDRIRENFRVATETFGLVQTGLEAFQRHATPEIVVGFYNQFKSKEDHLPSGNAEEWSLMKLIYRRHMLTANDEVRFLSEMDQKLEEKFTSDIFDKIKRINDRLASEGKSDDPQIKIYKAEIDRFNRRFSELENQFKGT